MFPNGPQGFQFPLFPGMMFHQQPPQAIQPERPPVRIRVAMEYLSMLDHKTMPRAAASDAVCIELEKTPLVIEEEKARVVALKLLETYFEGKYELSKLEKETEKKQKEKSPLTDRITGAGMVLRCVGCGNRPAPTPTCVFCKGTGEILVFPTYSEPKEGEET